MESLVYVALTPLAVALMLVVGGVAWRRREAPGGVALVAFTMAGVGWLAVDALALLAPTPAVAIWLVRATCLFGPLLGVSWLAFVLGYTERSSRAWRLAVGLLTAWALVYGALALTDGTRRLVWATWEVVPDGALTRVAYTLGPLGWAQTVTAWTGVALSLGVLMRAYSGPRARALSRWIVAGAFVPMALNVAFLVGIGPLAKDFTPIAMAVSSAAFGVGLARYQFLDLRPIARAALLDNLREGVLVLDAYGRVADANPALRRVLGPHAAALGRPLGETAPALAHAIDAAPDAPFCLGHGADARFFDLRVSPLTDRTRTPSGRLVLLHDVTRRRQEQAALVHANDQLEARNEELDAFAHTVAHDLKNSIHVVMASAEILRDDGPSLLPSLHLEIADGAVAAARKMGTVVHELLLLAGVRQAAIELVPVAMGPVVMDALARVGSDGAVSVPPRWPVARGHAPWVEEIWVNYLTNAAKYGGPTVTVGAEVTAGGHARFWVHDDGPGLAPDEQARLFVPFSRLSAHDAEGHGLGLSIVRRIAERLGGACGVESAPGRGTRFWFTLPYAPQADAATAAVAAPQPSAEVSLA